MVIASDSTSPFSPGKPVATEFFVGRLPEIQRLRDKIRSAMTGRLETVFIAGERGIGKSSLASFVGRLCEKELNALPIHTFLGGVDSLEGVVKCVFDQLVRDSAERPFLGKIKEFLGNRVTEAGLLGVSLKFDPSAQDLKTLANNFVPSISNLIKRLRDDRAGLVLILDDLNGLVRSSRFAHWLKSFVDEVSTSGQSLPLCLLLVGLEERRRALIEHNPSVTRIFDIIDIHPWDKRETRDFYENAFHKAGMSVEEEAMPILVRYSGGLPVLAHEIGDSAFAVDKDGRIDEEDAFTAVVDAADVIGRKHLDPLVFRSIRSKKYRAILATLAKTPPGKPFLRAQLKDRLGHAEERVLDNFLKRMKSLGVIVDTPEEGRGWYRFSNSLHQLYFFMEARRMEGTTTDDDD